MNKRSIAVLSFRVVAGYFVALGVIGLPECVTLLFYAKSFASGTPVPTGTLLLSAILPVLSQLVVGALLWIYSPLFADMVFPSADEPLGEDVAPVESWLSSGFIVIGAYFAAIGIAGIISSIAYSYLSNEQFVRQSSAIADRLLSRFGTGRSLVTSITEAVVGIVLFSCANSLVAWFYRQEPTVDRVED